MPALPQLYPYKAGPIEPIVLPGELVGILTKAGYNFYRVSYIESINYSDPLITDLGAIAAGGQTAVTQLTLLEMQDKEFGQFRGRVLEDFEAMLYQGRADQRLRTANRVSRFSMLGGLQDPDGHQGEFYVYHDTYAFMQGFNLRDYALTLSRVAFWGNRYALEDTEFTNKNQPKEWTRVPAMSHL